MDLPKDLVLLVDADSITFGAGFATEKKIYLLCWEDKHQEFPKKKELDQFVKDNGIEEYEVFSRREVEPVANALHLAGRTLRHLKDTLKSDNMEVYLTGDDNFRYDIATIQPYKGNRKEQERPTHELAIRQYMIDNWGAEVIHGEEADDAVSIRAHQLFPYAVVVSADKDLDMVPGWHSKVYNPEPYYITPEQGMYNFYYQLLIGDTTDHIRGCPGIGKVKAERILADCDPRDEVDMYLTVLAEYINYHVKCLQKEGLDFDDTDIEIVAAREVTENARLLWMRTYPDELWMPPTYEEEVHEEGDETGGELYDS